MLKDGQRNELESAFVRRGENDRGRLAGLDRFEPAARAQTPAVTGMKTGKPEFGTRRNEVIPRGEIRGEESVGDLNAHRVTAKILGARIAVPIPKKTSERFERAWFQWATKDIARRKRSHAVKSAGAIVISTELF